MRSRRSSHKKSLSLLISLVLVLVASLLFGQVMGNLYLDNIATANHDSPSSPDQVGDSGGRTKVLRLKTIPYYTIEVVGYEERETAIRLGNTLAEKGLPVVITGTAPFRVRLAFLSNEEKLLPLAQTILVDGNRAKVIKGELNVIPFKFASNDAYSTEKIAPFLGDLSLCLEKALLLNSDLDTNAANVSRLKPKFAELAGDVEILAQKSLEIASQGKDSKHVTYLADLAMLLHNWGQSLVLLGTDWSNAQLLNSQQQALVVVEEYQRFLNSTN